MTLLEKPKAPEVPEVVEAPRHITNAWVTWLVLATLIVAGFLAAAILTAGEPGVAESEVGASLAFDNYQAAKRISALDQAVRSDQALMYTILTEG